MTKEKEKERIGILSSQTIRLWKQEEVAYLKSLLKFLKDFDKESKM